MASGHVSEMGIGDWDAPGPVLRASRPVVRSDGRGSCGCTFVTTNRLQRQVLPKPDTPRPRAAASAPPEPGSTRWAAGPSGDERLHLSDHLLRGEPVGHDSQVSRAGAFQGLRDAG